MRRLLLGVLLAVAFNTFATDSTSEAFSGHWKGTIGTASGSGPFEVTLAYKDKAWSGNAAMGGQDGTMHGGRLKDIQVAGASLRFTVEFAEGPLSAAFRGELREGKLGGAFDGFNGGQKVTEGTWAVTREKPSKEKDGSAPKR